jgi:hypothetical protein
VTRREVALVEVDLVDTRKQREYAQQYTTFCEDLHSEIAQIGNNDFELFIGNIAVAGRKTARQCALAREISAGESVSWKLPMDLAAGSPFEYLRA